MSTFSWKITIWPNCVYFRTFILFVRGYRFVKTAWQVGWKFKQNISMNQCCDFCVKVGSNLSAFNFKQTHLFLSAIAPMLPSFQIASSSSMPNVCSNSHLLIYDNYIYSIKASNQLIIPPTNTTKSVFWLLEIFIAADISPSNQCIAKAI